MKIRGIGKVRRTMRHIQKQFSSKGLILLYHRIAEAELDPWSLCVTPQHFAEHLEILQQCAHPISLSQLAQAHRNGHIPHRSVAVTFDDGYADNLYTAKPLLERYQVPATVFVATGQIGQEREFWWDELERLLLQPRPLPETLRLHINGTPHSWELGQAANYTAAEYERDRHCKAWQVEPSPRLHFYYTVWQQLQALTERERLSALDHILAWTNTVSEARSTHRSMRSSEICMLDQGEWVEVGAHTVTHPFLSSHPAEFQQAEIQRSRADLEKILSRTVTSFAYPFGNYNQQTPSLVEAAGFTYACSTVEDTVWPGSDRFLLPRFEVQNWNGEDFRKQLLRWLRG